MRRRAPGLLLTKVSERLYLGCSDDAESLAAANPHQIKAVLTLSESPVRHRSPAVRYIHFPVRDGRPVPTAWLNTILTALEENLHKLDLKSGAVHNGDAWELTGKVANTSEWPALMVRIKVVREKSGDRILPVIYSDNYIALMPGESQTITAEVKEQDARGEKPTLLIG